MKTITPTTSTTDQSILDSQAASLERTKRDLYRDFDPRDYKTIFLLSPPSFVAAEYQGSIDAELARRGSESPIHGAFIATCAAFALWVTIGLPVQPAKDTAKVRQEIGAVTKANPLGEVRYELSPYQAERGGKSRAWGMWP